MGWELDVPGLFYDWSHPQYGWEFLDGSLEDRGFATRWFPKGWFWRMTLTHQNRTIAIASDFRVDEAKSPEIPQKGVVSGSEIVTRNRKSLATFHRTLKSQRGSSSVIFFLIFGGKFGGIFSGFLEQRVESFGFGAFFVRKFVAHIGEHL